MSGLPADLNAESLQVILPEDAGLAQALDDFCQAGLDRAGATAAIATATGLLTKFVPGLPEIDLVVPVVRAGLAMLSPVDALSDYQTVIFAVCRRTEQGVSCFWTPPQTPPSARHALVLDVVTATGNTMRTVLPSLLDQAPMLESVTVATCFATPLGVSAIASVVSVPTCLVVGRLCDGIDDAGYVIPPTNGDAGDKLFGVSVRTTSSTSQTRSSMLSTT